MTKQRGLLALALFFLLVAVLLWGRSKHFSLTNEISSLANKASFRGKAPSGSPGEIPPSSDAKDIAAAAAVLDANFGTPATPEELASLKKMTEILSLAAKPGAREADLLKALHEGKQDPFVVDDNNPVTGNMDILRTKAPLPGTRYFHAQYFGDGKNEKFMQHISFEFKPGPQALQQAIAAAQSAFHVGKPEQTRDNFYQWTLNDGYCAWVSPLEEKDMQDHPFNAYSPEDKGSIRVAVELCGQEGD